MFLLIMLFNFQGPNLLRCIEVFHRNSLFIIACRFEFVKLFFKIFLNRFGSASRNFLTGSPFGFLSDRSGVPLSDSSIIIPRQLPFVNTFFTLFLTFFEKSGFFLKIANERQIFFAFTARLLIDDYGFSTAYGSGFSIWFGSKPRVVR